ncbi:hypothetical protein ATSB10_11860 [Dyella thiooxydans]|uniref:Uncharacterized protein n=1 Tax=Dyella thiooxydans TaxID=445710 RepID=A0A160MZ95_9GAMM|nr:hypothetical protein ATSB10_11860 [Dyella thiooxydans]
MSPSSTPGARASKHAVPPARHRTTLRGAEALRCISKAEAIGREWRR